jgi:hypothetical protein
MAAGQCNPGFGRPLELEHIMHWNRVHHRFQFVKTIGALPEDIQEQVYLAGGTPFEPGHKKRRQHESWRPEIDEPLSPDYSENQLRMRTNQHELGRALSADSRELLAIGVH